MSLRMWTISLEDFVESYSMATNAVDLKKRLRVKRFAIICSLDVA